MDTLNHTCLHFIDTVKVRFIARNNAEDVCYFFKNDVMKKPVISGLTAGFTGGLLGSAAFISTYNEMTHQIYTNEALANYDFRLKNMLIYLSAEGRELVEDFSSKLENN